MPKAASALPLATASAAARCEGSVRSSSASAEAGSFCAASSSSSTTRVPVPRVRLAKRTPLRHRSASVKMPSGLPGATISPCVRRAKLTSLWWPGRSSGR